MLINFNEIDERMVPGMNGGTGKMTAKMFMDEQGKIIPCHIHAGGSVHQKPFSYREGALSFF